MISWKEIGGVTLLASTVVLTGCATAGAETNDSVSYSQTTPDVGATEMNDDRVASLESELENREARISDLQSQLRSQEQPTKTDLFPPNAKPGQCYARVLKPEKYRTLEERLLVKEASEVVEVTPARFENEQERVLVKEASTRIEIIPAEYEMVTERVLAKPASKKIVQVPATFRTVTEQVLDKPAYTVWKRGPASGFSDPVLAQNVTGTGEVMCLVEVPASYKTITRSVVDVAAHAQEIDVPAEYKTVEKRVVKRPAASREVTIPAEYDTVTVRKLVEEAKQSRRNIPEEYRTVTRTEKISDAELTWQPVLCQVNATPENVMALQRSLAGDGYLVGPIDGILGPRTISAVGRYAEQKGIAHGANYVPIEVLKALDLSM